MLLPRFCRAVFRGCFHCFVLSSLRSRRPLRTAVAKRAAKPAEIVRKFPGRAVSAMYFIGSSDLPLLYSPRAKKSTVCRTFHKGSAVKSVPFVGFARVFSRLPAQKNGRKSDTPPPFGREYSKSKNIKAIQKGRRKSAPVFSDFLLRHAVTAPTRRFFARCFCGSAVCIPPASSSPRPANRRFYPSFLFSCKTFLSSNGFRSVRFFRVFWVRPPVPCHFFGQPLFFPSFFTSTEIPVPMR